MIENDKKWYEILSINTNTIEILYLKENKIESYRIVTPDQIREKVVNGESINLDFCYVKDFSYENICGLDSKLKNFHACNTFFDGNVSFKHAFFVGDVCFEHAVFGNGTVSFDEAKFYYGIVDFTHTRFGYCSLSFESARFVTEYRLQTVAFSYADFYDGNVSFNDTYFGKGDTLFDNACFGDGRVSFSNALFDGGNLVFNYAHFGKGAKKFDGIRMREGSTWFTKTDFSDGYVSFHSADFGGGRVSFFDAKFGEGQINFEYVCFGESTKTNEFGKACVETVEFQHAQFGEGNISFSYAQFENRGVNFTNSQFGNGDVIFDHAVFGNRDIEFRKVYKSRGNVTFLETRFENGKIVLDEAVLNNTTVQFKDCILNSVISLNQCKISKLLFFNCTNHDMINFGKQTKCIIQMIAFFYHNNMGTILLNWDIYKNSVLGFRGSIMYEIIGKQVVDLTKPLFASELKMLKENYHNQGEYRWEDETYVQYKKLDTKQLSIINPKRWILTILGFVGKYGTDPGSVFGSMIIAVVVFGLLYLLPGMSIYPKNATKHIWSPFYYSLITFLTIGYGDLSAQNWQTALICGIEGFLGVFMMSYFSVAVVRKILR